MLAWVARWGYLGLFVALFAEESGVPLPVPGDVFIVGLGAAGRAGQATFAPTALAVLCAVIAGSTLLYETSRRVGHLLLVRVGRRFGFDADRVDRVERWLERYGSVSVIAGRLTPGLRIVVTVAAGALRMRRGVFYLGTSVAALLWATLDYWAGYLLGAGITGALRRFVGRTMHEAPAVAAIVVVGVLATVGVASAVVWRKTRARRRRSRVTPVETADQSG